MAVRPVRHAALAAFDGRSVFVVRCPRFFAFAREVSRRIDSQAATITKFSAGLAVAAVIASNFFSGRGCGAGGGFRFAGRFQFNGVFDQFERNVVGFNGT
ncbi:MAG: hypothetical protein AB1405_01605 [Bdellovibrionota bacterium]